MLDDCIKGCIDEEVVTVVYSHLLYYLLRLDS